MGLLDLPAPLFDLVDGAVSFLPAVIRLALWSVVAGAVSMALYAVLSPQKKISAVKEAVRSSQARLAESDESFSELMEVARQTLGLSFRHLGLVLGPALLSSLPLICIMAWASTRFGYEFPEPGEAVTLSGQPEAALASLKWQTSGAEAPVYASGLWTIQWPNRSQGLVLADDEDSQLLQLPLAAPVPQIHKQLWWNSLLGNPSGYLPDRATVDLIQLSIPERRYLSIGPDWVGHWLTLFLIASVAGALVTKKLFNIH